MNASVFVENTIVTGTGKLAIRWDPAYPAAKVGTDIGHGRKALPILCHHINGYLILADDPTSLILNVCLKKSRGI